MLTLSALGSSADLFSVFQYNGKKSQCTASGNTEDEQENYSEIFLYSRYIKIQLYYFS